MKYTHNKFAQQRTTSRWAKNNAHILLEHLPATLKGLMRKSGYSSHAVEKFLIELRREGLIYTIQAGPKTTYERRTND